MEKRVCALSVIVVVAFTYAVNAKAECRKAQVCDDYGRNCEVRDICDSTLDLPSIDLPPLQPLPSIDLKPLPSTELPPLGTSHCEYRQVDGQWQNICE